MNISIELISRDEKEILRNLTEKYEYEFSQYEDTDVNNLGLFGYKYIDHYWTDENRFAYFIKIDGKLAGFIMLDDWRYIKIIEAKYSISEFFVMLKYKRQGIGTYVINHILNKYKGKWQIGYNPKNTIGKTFWNKVINDYTKGKYKLIIENVDQKYPDGTMAEVLSFES
jgi:predicted acetyltransferase